MSQLKRETKIVTVICKLCLYSVFLKLGVNVNIYVQSPHT